MKKCVTCQHRATEIEDWPCNACDSEKLSRWVRADKLAPELVELLPMQPSPKSAEENQP